MLKIVERRGSWVRDSGSVKGVEERRSIGEDGEVWWGVEERTDVWRSLKKNRTRGVDRGTWSREERKRAELGQENHRYRVACEKCEK